MSLRVCARVLLFAIVFAAVSWATPAAAQFRPPTELAVGERYHFEMVIAWWDAEPTLVLNSTSIDIPGTDVDLINDLGIEKKRLRDIRLALRPAKKHKFRFHYLPIEYEAEATLQTEFVFNGQRYRVGLPVQTTATMTTYRVGYEYDFFYASRGFAGVLIDLKYTDVDVTLDSPIGTEFTRATAPIPTIGGVGRGYIAKNVSLTGEVSYFRVPENIGRDEFAGRYLDYDFYGTINFTDYAGVQLGYRDVKVNYQVDLDIGDLRFKGWYFSGVVRF